MRVLYRSIGYICNSCNFTTVTLNTLDLSDVFRWWIGNFKIWNHFLHRTYSHSLHNGSLQWPKIKRVLLWLPLILDIERYFTLIANSYIRFLLNIRLRNILRIATEWCVRLFRILSDSRNCLMHRRTITTLVVQTIWITW